MKIIKGKYNMARVMIDDIDEATHDQIQSFVNHPAFGGNGSPIAIMPDCHAGKGSCVGFTMPIGPVVMPQVIGVDIGCGMLAADFGPIECDPVKLDEFIKANIPAGHEINEKSDCLASDDLLSVCEMIGADTKKVLRATGSLGGGNHFIEASLDNDGHLWIVIHSGSRNFGKRVADFYQAKARELMREFFIEPEADMEFMPRSQEFAGDYLRAMRVAQKYASENRHEMMRRIASWFDANPIFGIESVHNYIDFEDNIIRKGAIRANLGELCIIPFNSAEGSAICRGKGNAEWNNSAPHGAGRLMSRSKAFETLDYKEYQARLAANGVYSSTANSDTLDEAPMAYKPKDTILAAIEPTVEVITMLRPFYNFKAAEGGRRR